MKNNEDFETTIRLYSVILQSIELQGRMSVREVALCIRLEQGIARKYLRLLMKTGLLRSIEVR